MLQQASSFLVSYLLKVYSLITLEKQFVPYF
jgi:hypothetical protein